MAPFLWDLIVHRHNFVEPDDQNIHIVDECK